jgi:hypothetical protein
MSWGTQMMNRGTGFIGLTLAGHLPRQGELPRTGPRPAPGAPEPAGNAHGPARIARPAGYQLPWPPWMATSWVAWQVPKLSWCMSVTDRALAYSVSDR